ncbi:hypothetical protein [Clostridium intestinale]|uniref:Uncharacterized protein n=1 Tax=Clostridium intestinale DSM 6191 TaxID=1121320 RepID=A0A1M5U252_9CLOT|nr:hypothetical protein [Clostridium intestinale]SHH57069.1 hypothetical protein SAMN02745941_00385 [Clostridium intestinale DSM 6191]
MSEALEQIKGFVKAFEAINNGKYEGTDYLIDEFKYNGNQLLSIKNYLMKITSSNYEPESLIFEDVGNWRKTFEILFRSYFTRNIEILENIYKIEFIKMLNKYIDNEQVEVWGSGINDGFSCITKYFKEVSGSDLLFVFKEKILIFHFGIND